jgi:nucleoid DNA-binding protein
MNMTKKELTDKMAEITTYTKIDAQNFLGMLEQITQWQLGRGEDMLLPNIGILGY